MSYTNGVQTLIQSMNGILSFNDGQGTIIENGSITVNSINLNNILAAITTASCSLWSNLVGAVQITIGTISTITSFPGSMRCDTIGGYNLSTGTGANYYLWNDVPGARPGAFYIANNSYKDMYINNSAVSDGNTFLGSGAGTVDLAHGVMSVSQSGMTLGLAYGSSEVVQIGSQTNTNAIGRFLMNSLGNGGSLLPNFDTFTTNQEMVIGSNNASQIWLGNTNANSQITSRGLIQVNNGLRMFNSYLYLSSPPQTFTNKGIQNATGGQFNSNLNGKNELDLVCYSGAGTTSGLNVYSTNTQTNPVSSTNTLVASMIQGQGLRVLTGGISFDKGNITLTNSATGWWFQTGTNTGTDSLANATARERTVTFPTAFKTGTVPFLFLTGITTTTNTVTNAFIYSYGDNDLTATGFNYWAKNTSQSASGGNVWGVSWLAIGQY